ncbi:JAB domain-containing protein [Parasediminibacterium sp. JCM 36343]|uniref:JAB domain-containing protein n=1 Tax=Parasediminibacterium sp. JCM 36343 TaxID=3374279 RepID=UPI003978BC0F
MEIPKIEISYIGNTKLLCRPKIQCSEDSFALLLQNWDKGKIGLIEEFKILLLNRSNRVLGIVDISSGGITSTVVDLRIIFAVALQAAAVGIILAHNHPSFNLHPSQSDIAMTEKIRQAGCIMEIKLQDHLIITPELYYSFADEGRI